MLLLVLSYADPQSCRGALQSAVGGTPKKSKTPKKRSKDKSGVVLSENANHAVTFVAAMDSVPEELRTGAVKRLHTLIADMGHLSEAQMAVETQADQQDKKGGEAVHSVLLQGQIGRAHV